MRGIERSEMALIAQREHPAFITIAEALEGL
jgi:hypothetical protein